MGIGMTLGKGEFLPGIDRIPVTGSGWEDEDWRLLAWVDIPQVIPLQTPPDRTFIPGRPVTLSEWPDGSNAVRHFITASTVIGDTVRVFIAPKPQTPPRIMTLLPTHRFNPV
jgi:hypothetical protein